MGRNEITTVDARPNELTRPLTRREERHGMLREIATEDATTRAQSHEVGGDSIFIDLDVADVPAHTVAQPDAFKTTH